VLLVDCHVVVETTRLLGSSCVLLVDCNIVIETMADDLSYRWHGSSCVLLVDCRVVNGLLMKTSWKDTSLAKREC
jgi:hypothetical protein